MSEGLLIYTQTLGTFVVYFLASLALLAVYLVIYTWITPHREWALIREGNVAAAISLAGAGLGMVIPLASTIAHSLNLRDMVIWGSVAMIVQLLTFLGARLLLPQLSRDIAEGRPAGAVALAALSVSVGVLNAASMTY